MTQPAIAAFLFRQLTFYVKDIKYCRHIPPVYSQIAFLPPSRISECTTRELPSRNQAEFRFTPESYCPPGSERSSSVLLGAVEDRDYLQLGNSRITPSQEILKVLSMLRKSVKASERQWPLDFRPVAQPLSGSGASSRLIESYYVKSPSCSKLESSVWPVMNHSPADVTFECGRGDKRTKKGKIFKHSYGNTRPSRGTLQRRLTKKLEPPAGKPQISDNPSPMFKP